MRSFHYIVRAEFNARPFHRRHNPNISQIAMISSILTKTMRHFHPVKDITRFKRSFHYIVRAEFNARPFHRRHNPNISQTAMISSILKKTERCLHPVIDFSTFKRSFDSIYALNVMHSSFTVETSPRARKSE
jgi:hypothetical protein